MLNAADGKLYGLCPKGGANNAGVIYKIDPVTDAYTDVFDFSTTDGIEPYGSLTQASDGNLYGCTFAGGKDCKGVLFSYNPFTKTYKKLIDFQTSTGANPYDGKLFQATDGKLYGTTDNGGSFSSGVIFSYNIATDAYADVFDFSSLSSDIYLSKCGVIEATDGLLYGTLQQYSPENSRYGSLYSFNRNTNTYTDLHDFTGTDEQFPQRALKQGASGKLYGTAFQGGVHSNGVAYSCDITSFTFTKLIDFDGGIAGGAPVCEINESGATATCIADLRSGSSVKIYPNPAVDFITIVASDKEEALLFTDLLGKDLGALKINANSKTNFNVSSFPNIFFVKSSDGVQRMMKSN